MRMVMRRWLGTPWRERPFPLHPLLVAAYPVLFLYAQNLGELELTELVGPLAAIVVAAIVALVVGATCCATASAPLWSSRLSPRACCCTAISPRSCVRWIARRRPPGRLDRPGVRGRRWWSAAARAPGGPDPRAQPRHRGPGRVRPVQHRARRNRAGRSDHERGDDDRRVARDRPRHLVPDLRPVRVGAIAGAAVRHRRAAIPRRAAVPGLPGRAQQPCQLRQDVAVAGRHAEPRLPRRSRRRPGPRIGRSRADLEQLADHAVGQFLRERGYRYVHVGSGYGPTETSTWRIAIRTPAGHPSSSTSQYDISALPAIARRVGHHSRDPGPGSDGPRSAVPSSTRSTGWRANRAPSSSSRISCCRIPVRVRARRFLRERRGSKATGHGGRTTATHWRTSRRGSTPWSTGCWIARRRSGRSSSCRPTKGRTLRPIPGTRSRSTGRPPRAMSWRSSSASSTRCTCPANPHRTCRPL